MLPQNIHNKNNAEINFITVCINVINFFVIIMFKSSTLLYKYVKGKRKKIKNLCFNSKYV